MYERHDLRKETETKMKSEVQLRRRQNEDSDPRESGSHKTPKLRATGSARKHGTKRRRDISTDSESDYDPAPSQKKTPTTVDEAIEGVEETRKAIVQETPIVRKNKRLGGHQEGGRRNYSSAQSGSMEEQNQYSDEDDNSRVERLASASNRKILHIPIVMHILEILAERPMTDSSSVDNGIHHQYAVRWANRQRPNDVT